MYCFVLGFFNTPPVTLLLHTRTHCKILRVCLCKTRTEEMTSLRKLDVGFTRGQQNVSVKFFPQLGLHPVKLQNATGKWTCCFGNQEVCVTNCLVITPLA